MTQSSVQQISVLVLGNPEGLGDFALGENHRVQYVHSLEEAVSALRRERYGAVICRPSDILQFQGFHTTDKAAAIIDSVGEGICIVDEAG